MDGCHPAELHSQQSVNALHQPPVTGRLFNSNEIMRHRINHKFPVIADQLTDLTFVTPSNEMLRLHGKCFRIRSTFALDCIPLVLMWQRV